MKSSLRDFLVMAAVAALVFVALRTTVQTFVVYGPSMQPSFWEEQRLLVNKLVYNFHEPQRGDVIIFRPPHNQRDTYIKRVIGLPGEVVEMKLGRVYIHERDGSVVLLDEPYIKEPARRSFKSEPIPPGEYFVLGDNRNNTNDSRNGWTVPRHNIIGKAWVSIWPPDRWGLAANYPLQGQVASAASD